jgi:hypothetical protein
MRKPVASAAAQWLHRNVQRISGPACQLRSSIVTQWCRVAATGHALVIANTRRFSGEAAAGGALLGARPPETVWRGQLAGGRVIAAAADRRQHDRKAPHKAPAPSSLAGEPTLPACPQGGGAFARCDFAPENGPRKWQLPPIPFGGCAAGLGVGDCGGVAPGRPQPGSCGPD